MFARSDRPVSLLSLALLAVLSGCGSAATNNVPAASGASAVALPTVVGDNNGKGKGGGGGGKGKCGGLNDPSKGGGGGSGILYGAILYGHDLNVYSTGSSGSGLQYQCTLTQGVEDPNGTIATVNGWWYVANGGGENVLVYQTKKSGPQGPVSTLADYNEYPTNVYTNPNRNTVAVSNLDSVSGGGGSVSVYLHRQAVFTRMLTVSGYGSVYGAGIAITHGGDCYWGFNTTGSNSSGYIVKFSKCNGNATVVLSGIPQVGGITFDQSDNLYYVNSVAYGSIAAGVYKCAKTSEPCNPFENTTTHIDYVQPTNLNFDYKGKDLWVADPGAGYIYELNSSGGLELSDQVGTGNYAVYGVAPEPGQ
ncbi:MAG TPA: hypothetical protein VGX91_11445 [Candidatus Cybelea sp.]|jgi:hypothetical protein|nr:hypothetical protein [Candidatus Cybelea sp.]